jgi:NAD(P)-dependent dehydrogenase (short-subunit alcohol dehydrogenase family)
MMGGTGPADAAIDALVRNLAAEIGPRGVRVLGIWTAGLPETFSREKLAAVDGTLALDDVAYQGLVDSLDQMRMTRRSPGWRRSRPRRVPGFRKGRRHNRHVRQRHQRDVPQLAAAGGEDVADTEAGRHRVRRRGLFWGG